MSKISNDSLTRSGTEDVL